MNPTIRLAALILLPALASPAFSGDIYKWTDAQGNVHYGDAPKSEGAQKVDVGPVNSEQAIAAQKATADAKKAKSEQCKQAKDQLATYRSATSIIEKDALGREHQFSGDDRQKLIDRSLKQVADACGADAAAADNTTGGADTADDSGGASMSAPPSAPVPR